MSILMTALIVASGVAAVLLLRKTGEVSWAMPAAIACVALTLILAVGKILSPGGSSSAKGVLTALERYQEICGTYVGEEVGARHPGARVVILTPPRIDIPGAPTGPDQQILVDSLTRALQGKVASVEVQAIEIPQEILARFPAPSEGEAEGVQAMMAKILMDTSVWFSSRRLAQLLTSLQDEADLVISTLELEVGTGSKVLPPAGHGPALVLINAWMDDAPGALQDTVLDSVVLQRTDPEAWKTGAKIPRDTEAAFNLRYLLVTEANVGDLAGRHPSL